MLIQFASCLFVNILDKAKTELVSSVLHLEIKVLRYWGPEVTKLQNAWVNTPSWEKIKYCEWIIVGSNFSRFGALYQ